MRSLSVIVKNKLVISQFTYERSSSVSYLPSDVQLYILRLQVKYLYDICPESSFFIKLPVTQSSKVVSRVLHRSISQDVYLSALIMQPKHEVSEKSLALMTTANIEQNTCLCLNPM